MSWHAWLSRHFGLMPPFDPPAMSGPITDTDWDPVRDGLAALRSILVNTVDAHLTFANELDKIAQQIDDFDPTPGALAAVADVTDINSRR